MNRKHLLIAITIPFIFFSAFNSLPEPTIEGRWDMTITMGDRQVPSWLEVRHSGVHHLIGEYVGGGGSARPVSKVNFTDGKMNFSVPPQWEQSDKEILFEGTLQV